MRVEYQAFALQKAGNSPDEYEDAFAPAAGEANGAEFRCAVADGATETSFSGLWARILVESFVERTLHLNSLNALSERWHEAIRARTQHKPLPWYAQEKLEQGAFSSLMGLTIRADGGWQALCVGDSCLFLIRPRQAIRAFPYHLPEQFNNHPSLLSTNENRNGAVKFQTVRGRWREGDYFLLMTDALAHFFLSQRHFRSLLVNAVSTPDDFEVLIAEARRDHLCRNDDVTFLKVCPRRGDAQGVLA